MTAVKSGSFRTLDGPGQARFAGVDAHALRAWVAAARPYRWSSDFMLK
jgi:hypothetical protein